MRSISALPVLSLLVLAGCGGQPPAQSGGMPPIPVGIASPVVRTIPVTRELTGRLEAAETVDVRPRVGGLIQRVLVADGAEVQAGDVLFELDAEPLQADLAQASAQVAQAEAQVLRVDADRQRASARLDNAKAQDKRAQDLFSHGNASARDVDDATKELKAAEADVTASEAAVVAAQATVAAAQASQQTARLNLGYAKVRAPIAGRLGKIQTNAGNLVQGGGPVPPTLLVNLVSTAPIFAVFDLDESTFRRLGSRLRTSAGGGVPVPVAVALPGETEFSHAGRVSFVDNQIDTGSGSIRLRAEIVDPDHSLTAGAFVRVQLEVEPPRPTVLINERAVMAQLATRYVYTIDREHPLPKGPAGGPDLFPTVMHPVTLGATIGTYRIVEQGLTPTDQIVVNNLAKIFFPGMPVIPVPASMETLQNAEAPSAAGEAKAAPEKTAADAKKN